jgi:E3 ubiquitin-protein ligase HUWE1
LNPLGQEQLAARPSIIPGIFSMFTSERHLKVLQDKENAVLIGTAIDELIRHHPSLRTSVFDSLLSTLSKIEDLGWAYEASEDVKHWYHLLPVSSVPGDHDIAMGDIEPDIEDAKPTATLDDEFNDNSRSFSSDDAPRAHDNLIVSFIDVLGRVWF